MRTLPEGLLSGQYGSLSDGRVEFTCWYDGRPVIESLPVSEWSQSFGQGQLGGGVTKLTVMDETGELAPWGVDDPLGVGGSLVQTRLILDRATVPLGWQRITNSSSEEKWALSAGPDGVWVSGGSRTSVDAEDLTTVVAGSKFVTPEAPPTGNTCVAEIRRLLMGIMDVTFENESVDIPIPPGVTYREERLDAVADLVEAMGCSCRVTGTGQLYVYLPTRASVWTVQPGQFGGNLINISRSQSISDLKNLIVARNTLNGGEELQAAAEETSGPLRVDGPHGRWPDFTQADFVSNEYEALEAARNTLNQAVRMRSVSIPLTTIFHPGLEVGDWITVQCPVTTGQTLPIEGRVMTIQYGGTRMPMSMNITVDCDLNAVQTVSDALRAQRWTR